MAMKYMLFASIVVISACSSRDAVLIDDIRLFNEVSVIADAVNNENIDKISEMARSNKNALNYQEPTYESTLLIWSILNNKYQSAERLLELGTDTEISDDEGITPLMYAADRDGDPKLVRLLLKYGANVNAVAIPRGGSAIRPRLETPLIASVLSYDLDTMRLIVDAGANIDYQYPGPYPGTGVTALSQALMHNQMHMARYLLIEKGADYKRPILRAMTTGKYVYIIDLINALNFEVDSEDYKIKLELLQYIGRFE